MKMSGLASATALTTAPRIPSRPGALLDLIRLAASTTSSSVTHGKSGVGAIAAHCHDVVCVGNNSATMPVRTSGSDGVTFLFLSLFVTSFYAPGVIVRTMQHLTIGPRLGSRYAMLEL